MDKLDNFTYLKQIIQKKFGYKIIPLTLETSRGDDLIYEDPRNEHFQFQYQLDYEIEEIDEIILNYFSPKWIFLSKLIIKPDNEQVWIYQKPVNDICHGVMVSRFISNIRKRKDCKIRTKYFKDPENLESAVRLKQELNLETLPKFRN